MEIILIRIAISILMAANAMLALALFPIEVSPYKNGQPWDG